jgi:hypothetical protein
VAGLVHVAWRLTPRHGQGGDQLVRLCSAGRAMSAAPAGSPAGSVPQPVSPVCLPCGYILVTRPRSAGSSRSNARRVSLSDPLLSASEANHATPWTDSPSRDPEVRSIQCVTHHTRPRSSRIVSLGLVTFRARFRRLVDFVRIQQYARTVAKAGQQLLDLLLRHVSKRQLNVTGYLGCTHHPLLMDASSWTDSLQSAFYRLCPP